MAGEAMAGVLKPPSKGRAEAVLAGNAGKWMDDYRNGYNDTTAPLGSVAPGGSQTGSIESSNDVDVFAVTLTAGRTYTIDMKGSASGNGTLTDLYFYLYNSAGSFLNSSS